MESEKVPLFCGKRGESLEQYKRQSYTDDNLPLVQEESRQPQPPRVVVREKGVL